MVNKRNPNLDLIKSVACVSVVGLHAVSMNNYTIYYLCDCGVPLFFMVNGYLLLSREQMDYRYVFHKIACILKIVLSWNFLIAIPVFIFRQKIINPFRLAFDSLLQKGYLWHFWFFSALIIIYLFLPVLHRLLFEKKHFHQVACLLLMVVCLYMDTFSMIKGYPVSMFVPQPLRLWTWMFYFISGGLFAAQKQKIQKVSLRMHGLPLKASHGMWISRFGSLTMGVFIIHPILLFALNTIFTSEGTIAVLCLWMGLMLSSLFISYIMSKIPVARELIKL